jgi:hypothetical protein
MSEIMLNVRDAGRAVHNTIHGSRLDYVVAALSADPETIEELQVALARFLTPDRREFFPGWRSGIDGEPWDAGICIIDLAARLVVVQSTYSMPGPRGGVGMMDPDKNREIGAPYHLADDWLFIEDVDGWEAVADKRRRARLAVSPIDIRAVLYGQVCEFIARECLRESVDFSATDKDAIPCPVSAIHARWLLTPRDDLGGQAPRDALLARNGHISQDMEDRSYQWSLVQACPPGLSPESAAYRFGGFGTHEIVVYYDMVRFLLDDCWEHLSGSRNRTDCQSVLRDDASRTDCQSVLSAEICRLEAVRDRWLETPDYENLSGHIPAAVIAQERARLPQGVSGAEAIHDPDCPCCQMLADLPGPMFWCLDGSHMDNDFAFSFYRTREEWEAEQRKWEELDRRYEEEENTKPDFVTSSIWRRSYAAPDALEQSPELALFGLGAHLAELTQDLKDAGAEQCIIDTLNRDFGNLRDLIQNPAAELVDPVTGKMIEALATIAESYPVLADKCADLEKQLCAFAERLGSSAFDDEDVPF